MHSFAFINYLCQWHHHPWSYPSQLPGNHLNDLLFLITYIHVDTTSSWFYFLHAYWIYFLHPTPTCVAIFEILIILLRDYTNSCLSRVFFCSNALLGEWYFKDANLTRPSLNFTNVSPWSSWWNLSAKAISKAFGHLAPSYHISPDTWILP